MITEAMFTAAAAAYSRVTGSPARDSALRAALEAAERAAPVPKACSGNVTDEELAELIKRPGYVQFVRDNGWQPIETAPKDGTRILVASGGAVLVVSYTEETSEHYTWITPDGYSIDAPTHWRPLPEPPNTEKVG